MHAIIKGNAWIDGEPVDVYGRKIFTGDVFMEAVGGTTGLRRNKPGCDDARVLVSLNCLEGQIRFIPLRDDDDERITGIKIVGCGIDSLKAIEKALRHIYKVLDEEHHGTD